MNDFRPGMEIADKVRFRTALSELVGKLQMRQWTLVDSVEFCFTRNLPANFFKALLDMKAICLDETNTDGEWYKREQPLFRLLPENVWDQLELYKKPMPPKIETSVSGEPETTPTPKTRKATSKVNDLAALRDVVTLVPEDKTALVQNPVPPEEAYPPIDSNAVKFIPNTMLTSKEEQTVTNDSPAIEPPYWDIADTPVKNLVTVAIDAADGTCLRYVIKTKEDVAFVTNFLDRISK